MKSIAKTHALLHGFETKYGFNIGAAEQGSEMWLLAKLGVISASNASRVVAKAGTETRNTFLCELIAQIITGLHHEIGGAALQWGKDHEDAMLAYYEFQTGLKVTKVPFIFMDATYREGCSPDFLVTDTKPGEIKCPWNSTNFVQFLLDNSCKPEWKWQNQFTLRVTEADILDFGFFDPRAKDVNCMKTIQVERDEKMQTTLADAVPQFIHDMDQALKGLGIEFGQQWRRLGNKTAS